MWDKFNSNFSQCWSRMCDLVFISVMDPHNFKFFLLSLSEISSSRQKTNRLQLVVFYTIYRYLLFYYRGKKDKTSGLPEPPIFGISASGSSQIPSTTPTRPPTIPSRPPLSRPPPPRHPTTPGPLPPTTPRRLCGCRPPPTPPGPRPGNPIPTLKNQNTI